MSEFFTELASILEVLATYRCPVLLLGDLNIHVERMSDEQVIEFNDLISSFDMRQLVATTTHKAGGCLDLMITHSSTVVSDINASETGISDHLMVTG